MAIRSWARLSRSRRVTVSVLQGLVVDRHRPRRADLVLAAVAAADRAALVVLGLHALAQLAGRRSRASSGWPSLRTSGSTATLTGASSGCRRSTVRVSPLDLVLVVGVDQERQHRAVGAGGRLDHVRDVALAAWPCRRTRASARVLGVLGEVEVAAVGDPLELLPADREQVLDVAGGAGVVRELVGVVGAQAQVVGADAELADTTRGARSSQCSNHCGASSGGTKNSISICSNSRVRKMKLPGVISLRKLLPIWAIPNGGFLRANCR